MIWHLTQRAAAAVLLIACLPLFAVLYVIVRLTSPGPFLFVQMRRGSGAEKFRIYKIRTMRAGGGPDRRLGVDQSHPSITRIGRVLRELKIDELPQLWNVVRGDMRLVGPRPLPLTLDARLAQDLPGFTVRRRVPPGLVNVGQLLVDDNGTDAELLADWGRRSVAERHYVRNAGVVYDLLVLGLAVVYLVRRLFGFVRRPRTKPGAATEVCGVRIDNLDYDGVLDAVRRWHDTTTRRYICVCPVHSIVEARRDPEHARALRASDLNTADGVPVVWSQRLLGMPKASRVYGPDLMLRMLADARDRNLRVGFYGSRPEVLELLVDRMRRRFDGLQIVSAIGPPFRPLSEHEDRELSAQICAAQPDLLFVGLGCPRQERWMAAHAEIPTVMVGVGAAFDFHAGTVRQCPRWLQRIGCEWLFRLCMEPRRLFVRYATTNPRFLAMLGAQLVRQLCGARFQREPTCTLDREVA